MSTSGSNPPTALLLSEHTGFLRALARELVSDASTADDLAQDALVIALERPPHDRGAVRGWLATVLRRLVWQRARSESSRDAREEASARPEAPDTAGPGGAGGSGEFLGRIQVQRDLADAMLALPEAYRDAVVLRFYENLPPRAIAARLDVPVATVKSRLARAIIALREELDRRNGGDRSAWAAVLLPLALPVRPAPLLSIGGLAVNAKVAVALVTVATGAVWFATSPSSPGSVPPQASEPALVGALDAPEPVFEPAAPVLRDEEGATEAPTERSGRTPVTAPATAKDEAPAATLFTGRGRVLNGDGDPLASVSVLAPGLDDAQRTDANGRFAFETTERSGRIELAEPGWVTIREGSWRADGTLDPILVIAPSIDLSGVVLDQDGVAVGGARVALGLPNDFRTRFRDVLDASFERGWSTITSSTGEFALDEVPAIAGARLSATGDGYLPTLEAAPLESDSSLVLRLDVSGQEYGAAVLAGRVSTSDGAPAGDARVTLGLATVRADARGLFRIPFDRVGREEADRIVAVQPGFQPATLERGRLDGDADEADPSAGWPDFVELVVDQPSLSISGRVVDAAGEPAPGLRIWLDDPTPFGNVGTYPVRLEGLMAGAPIPPRAINSIAELPDADGDESFGSANPTGPADALWNWIETDRDGRFELEGLADRDYTLRIGDPETLWSTATDPIAAGTAGETIRLTERDVHETLTGVIMTRHGDPLPGVRIQQWAGVVNSVQRVFGGTSHITRFHLGASTVTDADGRFELEGVPKFGVSFHLISDQILPSYASVEQIVDPGAFDIVVSARAHFEVELLDASAAEAIAAVDSNGERIDLYEIRADGYTNRGEMYLQDGKSGVVTTTSDAAELLLLSAGSVVDRIPLVLRIGDVQRIVR